MQCFHLREPTKKSDVEVWSMRCYFRRCYFRFRDGSRHSKYLFEACPNLTKHWPGSAPFGSRRRDRVAKPRRPHRWTAWVRVGFETATQHPVCFRCHGLDRTTENLENLQSSNADSSAEMENEKGSSRMPFPFLHRLLS